MILAGMSLAGLAFVVSLALCAGMRVVAPRVGLVDHPGGRKAHRRPTPLGGGVAIWMTVCLVLGLGAAVVAWAPDRLPRGLHEEVQEIRARGGELLGILVLASLIMVMGLADDRRALSPWPRLFIQMGLATVYVVGWGGVTLFLPHLAVFRVLAGVITVVWIVGLTNAFNFLDNMDGLAGSVGLIAALLFTAAQVAVESYFVPAVLLILVGALAGFLYHNVAPARLFMGDAGSNFLGFLLGTLTVSGTFSRPYEANGGSPYSVLTPLLVMAVPLYDTCSVILIRLREGRSPFRPDRSHFSHRLVERGLSPPRAVATIDLVTLAGGLGALLLHRAEDAGDAAVVLAQTVCLLGVVAVLEASVPAARKAPPPSEPRDAETTASSTG